MNMRFLKRLVFLIIPGLLIPLSLLAGEPMVHLKAATDNLVSVLSDKSLRPADMKVKRDRLIMEIVDGIFSWDDFSRRALGRHWNNRTQEERNEFASLLRQLIVNNYIDYAVRYSGERLILINDKTDGDFGIVTGKVITAKDTSVPIEFRMIRKRGTWWIYDINVIGLTFAGNYRSQINAIMKRSSFEDLIKDLREKVKGGTKGD
jgi:phospholipid transport system substrate-binding protein